MQPVLVLYASLGGGHKAAALALAEVGRARGREVELIDALSLAPHWFARAYVESYLVSTGFARSLYGATFSATDHRDPVRDAVRAVLDRSVGGELVAHVLDRRPAAVIATHFYPLVELGRLRRSAALDVPLIAVVTDYVAHALWAVPDVDLYCAPRGRAVEDLASLGVARSAIVETGIPVSRAFGAAAPWVEPGPGEPMRVLVTSGGFGVGPVLDVLRSFRGVSGVALDVVSGDRPALVARANKLVARHNLVATVTGFATDMPQRIGQAHVVIGKAGGLTMSECLASGRPLVVVGAGPGQEAGNVEVLEAWGAGIHAHARKVGPLVRALADDGALRAMASEARAHGAADAATRIWDLVDARTAASIWPAGCNEPPV